MDTNDKLIATLEVGTKYSVRTPDGWSELRVLETEVKAAICLIMNSKLSIFKLEDGSILRVRTEDEVVGLD